jgi:hypothetical protein
MTCAFCNVSCFGWRPDLTENPVSHLYEQEETSLAPEGQQYENILSRLPTLIVCITHALLNLGVISSFPV